MGVQVIKLSSIIYRYTNVKCYNKVMSKKIGRPTKYLPEIIYPKITEYITMCSRENTELPTIEGLAVALGVTSETIRDWTRKYKAFSSTIRKIADKQKNQLMNDGMYGGKEVNAAMAIFLLKANHGLKDGHETTVNVTVKPILGGASVIDAEEVKNVSSNNSNSEALEASKED